MNPSDYLHNAISNIQRAVQAKRDLADRARREISEKQRAVASEVENKTSTIRKSQYYAHSLEQDKNRRRNQLQREIQDLENQISLAKKETAERDNDLRKSVPEGVSPEQRQGMQTASLRARTQLASLEARLKDAKQSLENEEQSKKQELGSYDDQTKQLGTEIQQKQAEVQQLVKQKELEARQMEDDARMLEDMARGLQQQFN